MNTLDQEIQENLTDSQIRLINTSFYFNLATGVILILPTFITLIYTMAQFSDWIRHENLDIVFSDTPTIFPYLVSFISFHILIAIQKRVKPGDRKSSLFNQNIQKIIGGLYMFWLIMLILGGLEAKQVSLLWGIGSVYCLAGVLVVWGSVRE